MYIYVTLYVLYAAVYMYFLRATPILVLKQKISRNLSVNKLPVLIIIIIIRETDNEKIHAWIHGSRGPVYSVDRIL